MPLGAEKATLFGAAGGASSIKMYGGGGTNSGPDPIYNNTEVKIYDDADDSWSLGTTLTIGRGGFYNNVGASFIRDASNANSVFRTAYGFAGSTPSAEPSNYKYDAGNNTSATIGAAPGPNRGVSGYWSSTASWYSCCGSQYVSNWARFNVLQSQAYSDEAWTTKNTPPNACYYRMTAMMFSDDTNIVHIIGGKSAPVPDNGHNWGTVLTNTYEYSVSGDSFAAATALPSAGENDNRTWNDDKNKKLYCYSLVANMDLRIWDRAGDSWTAGASSTPTSRGGPIMAFNEGLGVGYISGGEAGSPESPTGNQFTGVKYDVAADSWSALTTETVGRVTSRGFVGGINN